MNEIHIIYCQSVKRINLYFSIETTLTHNPRIAMLVLKHTTHDIFPCGKVLVLYVQSMLTPLTEELGVRAGTYSNAPWHALAGSSHS